MDRNKACGIEWYLTSAAGSRVEKMGRLEFEARNGINEGGGEEPFLVEVDEGTAHQRMDGFGGTFNECGWYLLNLLDADGRESILRSFFHPSEGSGYTVCAAPVGHNDYSLSYYSYDETADDVEMRDFIIERDKGCLIPYIKAAAKYGSFTLATRPDYPPRWMISDDRRLLKQYYDAFAQYLARYVLEYDKAGIKVDYVSVFNEPGIYMQISGEEIAELVKNHIGPMFRKFGLKTGIQISDASERSQCLKEWPPVLDDPEAAQYVSTATFHAYWWERNPPTIIGELHEKYKDIRIWQSECMNLYTKPIYEYADGEVWGKMIMDDIQNGVSAWIFWNLIVDEEGGPWNKDPFNPGYDQDGIVIINQKDLSVTYTAKYYYFTHFSRFIKPGAKRVNAVDKDDILKWLKFCAFVNPDGSRVLIALNSNQHEMSFGIEHDGKAARCKLPGHSIATYIW